MACNCSRHLVLAVLLGGLCGCSESASSGGPGEPLYTLIDDMEAGDGSIRWVPAASAPDGEPGRWRSYVDAQCDDVEPAPRSIAGSNVWSYAALEDAYETLSGSTSRSASRLRTRQALVNQWGAGMGFDFALPAATAPTEPGDCSSGANIELDLATPAVAVDLAAYRGIVFWGKAEPSVGAREVRIMLQDRNTDPRGGLCDPAPDTETACYNGFGVTLELAQSFQRYEIDFAELRQNPIWGYRPSSGRVDLERVYQLNLEVHTPGGECVAPAVCAGEPPALEFDVWVDDLYFVGDAEP